MESYPYRPDLPGPGPINKIDFSNPALAPLVRMTARNLQEQVRRWAPPAGLRFGCRALPGAQDVPCFVLEPADARPRPGLLYLHGGGFFLPLQTAALRLAAGYAQSLGVRVFLPEYRLLPGHPAPDAWQDCRAVYCALREQAGALHLDGRVLLYGESAGGALTAGLAVWTRDAGCPPAGQALIYPVLDDLRGQYPSRVRYANAVWTQKSNEAMWRSYLRNGFSLPEGYLVPLRGSDFANLPPTYLEPQGLDALHDEAIAYAGRLSAAGVAVDCNDIPGSYHGFDWDTGNPFVQQVAARRAAALQRVLDAARPDLQRSVTQ